MGLLREEARRMQGKESPNLFFNDSRDHVSLARGFAAISRLGAIAGIEATSLFFSLPLRPSHLIFLLF
jgi:hypothetical protein